MVIYNKKFQWENTIYQIFNAVGIFVISSPKGSKSYPAFPISVLASYLYVPIYEYLYKYFDGFFSICINMQKLDNCRKYPLHMKFLNDTPQLVRSLFRKI